MGWLFPQIKFRHRSGTESEQEREGEGEERTRLRRRGERGEENVHKRGKIIS